MPDLVTIPKGAAVSDEAADRGRAVLGDSESDFPHAVKVAATLAFNRASANRLTSYSFVLRAGRNQADSLLLKPLVVSIRKSASVAWLRSTTPSRSAGTARRSQPGA